MLRRKRFTGFLISAALAAVIGSSCTEEITDEPHENIPPEVSVFLSPPEDGLIPTPSRQILHWDGKDEDGWVLGFYYTFGRSSDSSRWVFLPDSAFPGLETVNGDTAYWRYTTERTDTFALRILTDTLTYRFSLLAMDNDSLLSESPAVLPIPIKNSKPEVFFIGDIDASSGGVKMTDTTFTVVMFSWGSRDIDGDDTVLKFQYALDISPGDSADASKWTDISASKKSLILAGTEYETEADVVFDSRLSPGEHAFYLRAVDIAGAVSVVKRMPEDTSATWYVKAPVGDVLIIDDWIGDEGADFYASVMDSFSFDYSVLDIVFDNSALLPPTVTLGETMKLFKIVIWYSDVSPHLAEADATIPGFTEAGGKVLFSTLFEQFQTNQGDPLAFTPVDSMDVIRRPSGTVLTLIIKSWDARLAPEPDVAAEFPDTLLVSPPNIIPTPKQLAPKATSRALYRLESKPGRWIGEPVMIVEDVNRSFIFSSIPIHQLDGYGNMPGWLERILVQEFGL